MGSYELRKFSGFNAAIVDCEKCKNLSSLNSNDCLKCIGKIDSRFSLLELRKNSSIIYFDESLSEKIKSGIFELVPRVVPKFLLYYLVPFKGEEIIYESDFYKIMRDGSERIIVFEPPEYNLNIKELNEFSERVLSIQSQNDSDKAPTVPELKDEISELTEAYTKGLGIFDKILGIPELQDVFINSPGDSCVFFTHSKYGPLKSNLFVKKEMLNRLSTFLRTNSGRPFDESFPVIHTSIKEFSTRVCGLTYPMTYDGIGFALRKHYMNPLSISSMVLEKFMDASVAALIWFFIDSDIKLLITGPRGSGKTTLLSSLMFLSSKANRVIVIEDTSELPVPQLKELGFNVEHLRTNSFGSADSFEFSNDAALRTALRLGESLLVIGEVRGTEAKFLFEAMRIGASGNNVMGTIHGSNAFDTYDRVVNDLGVPATSFKAADLVISCSYFNSNNFKGRRVFEITEVKKGWFNNPVKEKGFASLVSLNPMTSKYSINLEGSELVKNVAYKNGVSVKSCIAGIKRRREILELIIDNYKRLKCESLLSNETIVELSGMIAAGVEHSNILKYVKSVFLKSDNDEFIADLLKSLKAFSKESAVDSKKLFLMSKNISRPKFNELISSLESKNVIIGFCKGSKRYWFIRR